MGKRRSAKQLNPDDRFKNDDDDDEENEEEENQEEPLRPEEIGAIQARKKLVARRRIGGAAPTMAPMSAVAAGGAGGGNFAFKGFSGFSSLSSSAAATSSENGSEQPSLFIGFKGFSSFKPASESTTTTAPAPTSLTTSSFAAAASTTTAPLGGASSSGFLTNGATTVPTSTSSNQLGSLFGKPNVDSSLFKPKNNGLEQQTPTTLTTTTSFTSSISTSTTTLPVTLTQNETNKSNADLKSSKTTINENELNFLSELSELFKRCHGNTLKGQRPYKLPIEVLNNGNIDSLGSEDDRKSKYAYLLAELNKNCSKWIGKHVDEDPYVLLTPVFVDYFNYLILLEKQFFPETFSKSSSSLLPSSILQTSSSSLSSGSSALSSSTNVLNSLTNTNKLNEEKENKHSLLFNSGPSTTSAIKFNGLAGDASSSMTMTTASSSSSSSLSFSKSSNNNNGSSHYHLNGHKNSKNDDDVQELTPEELEEQKRLSDSSKTFASLIKSTSSSGGLAASFSFGAKPATSSVVDTANKKESDSNSSDSNSSSQIKFAGGSSAVETKSTGGLSFLNSASKMSSTQPLFTFGAKKDDTPSSLSSSSTTQSKESGEAKQPSSLFNFGSKQDSEQPSSSIFGALKPNQPAGSSIFSSLNKPAAESSSSTEPKPFFAFSNIASKPLGSGGGIFGSLGGGIAPTNPLFGGVTASGGGGGDGGGEGAEGADDEKYEPPKPESCENQEEGSVFSKRLKLFYFKESEKKFTDRGIGNLYLKPNSSGDKTQLIIRADTKLGNILLNINLSKTLPISKMGAKDVSILCIANPEIQGEDKNKPCKFLFKVKTEEDANELVEKLNEYKR